MENPKLFISYSWSSDDHIDWVINLATELRDKGVDVTLDKWDLKEGHCANTFMEQMVNDDTINKVIIICDKEYAQKANQKKGGVGIETQIISPEIYSKIQQNKFVAILSEKDSNGNPYLPTYLRSRIHIDLSDDNIYHSNFQQLLRWIYDKPIHPKPPIGKKPSFLEQKNQINLGTEAQFRKTTEAIKQHKGNIEGSLNEFFSLFCLGMEKFRIKTQSDKTFDDQLIQNIEDFIPYRNQIIEIISLIAQYNTPNVADLIHNFFERLIPYTNKPEGINSWKETDFDNFKFIIHELFLYTIAILLKNGRFPLVGELIHKEYYVERNDDGTSDTKSFHIFRTFLKSLKFRNERLSLNRTSIHADLLKERSSALGVKFKDLMQADFILLLNGHLNAIRSKSYNYWHPETLVYLGWNSGTNQFEIFIRAKSKKYFDKIKSIFNIHSKEDLSVLIKDKNLLQLRFDGHSSISLENILNYESLATLD